MARNFLKNTICKSFFSAIFSIEHKRLGTFSGVYLPSFLQMVGVILYMRLGWITGNAGIYKMVSVIAMSSSILLITAFSMTSIVTNMKVGSGGAYYIISRFLGLEFGSAIGVVLCLSQMTSIALCVSGFAASITTVFPNNSATLIEVITIIALVGTSYVSTNLAVKMQFCIFVILALSAFSVFSGSGSNIPSSIVTISSSAETFSFWYAFSMFFPATTGIEAGMAMSGDLKKPSRSLPIGGIAAVITAYCLYTSLSIFLWNNVPQDLLKSCTMISYHVARYGFLIVLGIWGATLSSALGGVLGAPRTMQAIANDGILPNFLAKGYGKTNEPRIATLIVFVIATTATILTNINQIIPILTMVSLVSYTLLNFVAFFESLIQNPSWRPTFKTPWYVSLLGCCMCFITMLMINPGATIIVVTLITILCFLATSKQAESNWDDIRVSIFAFLAKVATYTLERLEKSILSWRPNILTILDPSLSEDNLIRFSHSLNHGKGFLTFASVISDDIYQVDEFKQLLRNHLEEMSIQGFAHITQAQDAFSGILGLIKNYGIGPIKPNTIIIQNKMHQINLEELCQFISNAYYLHKNVILFKSTDLFMKIENRVKQVDLWWRGKYLNNFELNLALVHILQTDGVWKNSNLTIKTIVEDPNIVEDVQKRYSEYSKKLRLKNFYFEPITDSDTKDFHFAISKYSTNVDLTFIGMRIPEKNEKMHNYSTYLQNMFDKTRALQNVAYIMAGEKISFRKIFHK